MPDDRFIHPRLRMSMKVSSLSDLEFRVWTDYILVADNFGVMPDSPAMIRAGNINLAARPEEQIREALDNIVKTGLLIKFSHQGHDFLCDPVWQDFQKVKYPSRTYYPAPDDETMASMSEETREHFKEHHPKLAAPQRSESELVDYLEAGLAKLLEEPILTKVREYRLGDYRLDLVARTASFNLVFEVKRQTITQAAIEQVARYRGPLAASWGVSQVIPVVVGSSIGPSLTEEMIRAAGVIALVIDDRRRCTVVVNPYSALRLNAGVLPAFRRTSAGSSSANGRGHSNHRHKAKGQGEWLEANGFDLFYAAYPRKKSPDTARKAWASALKRASAEEIMTGLHRQLPELKSREEKFIPYPASWLNAGGWKNEAGPKPPSGRANLSGGFNDTPPGPVKI